MDINFPALQSINDTVNLTFNDQLSAATSRFARFTHDTTSAGAAEVYPRLNMLPGMREWTGDRVANSLSLAVFEIINRLFESTISVARTDIEDDKFNLLTEGGAALGETAGRLPDLLVAAAMKAGHTTICYDGQNFFDTAHPDFTSTGAPTTSPNYVTGSSTPWYLLDISNRQKSFVYQRRRPYQLIPKFSMMDPQVFWNKEFEWGVDGRSNAGYGIWQYAFMSLQPLTVENLLAARTQMANYHRPDGAPMGVKGTLLVTPTVLYSVGKSLAEDQNIPSNLSNAYVASTSIGLLANQARGMFEAYEDEWLN